MLNREKEVMRVLFKGRHLRLLLGEDVLREDAKGVQRADANEGVVGLAEDGALMVLLCFGCEKKKCTENR